MHPSGCRSGVEAHVEMKRIWTLILPLVLSFAALAAGQITIPYPSFTATNDILSAEVNANNTEITSKALNRTGGTVTGNIAVDANITVDGVDISDFLTASALIAPANAGLKVPDTDASHY